MNQPTEERFNRLEAEQKQLKEEVRQLREQITEPMKVTRIEVASEDVIRRLDSLTQELHAISKTWLDTLQEHYTDHTAHFEKIEKAMADLPTKEGLEALLIKYLQPKPNGH